MHRNVHPLAPAHLSTYRRFPNERSAQIDGICTENGIQPLAAVGQNPIMMVKAAGAICDMHRACGRPLAAVDNCL